MSGQPATQSHVEGDFAGGLGKRCTQQNDAEIGIETRCAEAGLCCPQNALADLECRGSAMKGAAAFGGALERCDLHAVAGAVDVHVAGLQGGELRVARGEKRGLDVACGSAALVIARHARCARTVRRKSCAMASAMLMSATVCSPRHAGLELTSSTCNCPFGARIRSMPA